MKNNSRTLKVTEKILNASIDRRKFLMGSAAGLGGLLLPELSLASNVLQCDTGSKQLRAVPDNTAPEPAAPCLVFVFLRGGMDALSFAAPSATHDPANYNVYRSARPDIHLSQGLQLGSSKFMLHPQLTNLQQLFNERKLAVIQGAGSPNATRSHFDQMNYIESGTPLGANALSGHEGFLNRVLAAPGSDIQAAAINPSLPKYLMGEKPAVALGNGIDEFSRLASGGVSLGFSFAERILGLFQGMVDPSFCAPAAASSAAVVRAAAIARDPSSWNGISPISAYAPAGVNQVLAKRMREAARLIKNSPGTRVVAVEYGGWDHHMNIGVRDGTFADMMAALNHALHAFQQDMDSNGLGQRVVTVVMSEFGRPLAQNGSMGVDHGRGGAMLVMGSKVRGGVYARDWDLSRLVEGRDLRVTIDYRDVIGQLIQNHLGANSSVAFPGYALNLADLRLV